MRLSSNHGPALDVGLLTLRVVTGGLLAGHGAQKLFGSFGGYGLEGTAGWLSSLGLRPGKAWAVLAGGSELGGGALLALGLMHPVGPLAMAGPMVMAWAKAHAGKPIWVTSGGAELPLLNLAVASGLLLTGPGRISLDSLLGVETPKLLTVATALGVAGGIVAGLMAQPESQADAQTEPAQAVVTEGPAGGEGLHSASGVSGSLDLASVGGVSAASDLSNASGTVTYGGLAANMDPEQVKLREEIGSDPPGAFGFNLQGASDTTGEADEGGV